MVNKSNKINRVKDGNIKIKAICLKFKDIIIKINIKFINKIKGT